ncbi:MAG: hypothetical protein ACOC10_00595 [Bacteroidota bacterium]
MYMDGSKECELINNTLAYNTAGMVLNAGSEKHVVKNNLFFGNQRNQLTLPTQHSKFDENHIIIGNVLFSKEENQYCMIQMFRVKDFDWGIMDSNYYFAPYSDYVIEQRWEVVDTLSLKAWQTLSGKDQHSKECFYDEWDGYSAELKINESKTEKTIELEGDYVDIDNKPIETIRLKPYSSMVVVKKKKY